MYTVFFIPKEENILNVEPVLKELNLVRYNSALNK